MLSRFLDGVYLVVLLLLSPWLLVRAVRTGRYRTGIADKLLGLRGAPHGEAPRVWFHGVSVGEIHLLRQIVAAFRTRHPGWHCVVSSTTDAGLAEARRSFPDLFVFPFPFDFSWAVRQTFRRLNPSLLVLAEGEIWPNLLQEAHRRTVPVAVVNARMSPRSLARYLRVRFLVASLFRLVDCFAVQTTAYAAAFQALGVDPSRIHVTGSVKYDGAAGDRNHPRTHELRRLFNLTDSDTVWVAGSTMAPEEAVVAAAYGRLRRLWPNLRLIVVPRQPDRFDEAADVLRRNSLTVVRRTSLPTAIPDGAVILLDTIGELAAAWGLADVAFVGGSLDGKRGGQNMIEPAAYGAAVVYGPHVWNFAEPARLLAACGGARQVADAAELERVTAELIADPAARHRLGATARDFVARQQGATSRTIDALGDLIEPAQRTHAA